MAKTIKIGDKVLYKSAFGIGGFKEAVVETIEIDCKGKDGMPVDEVLYPSQGLDRRTIMTLDNGHWGYGDQIKPMPNN